MIATSHSLLREVDNLVLEQIHLLKEPISLTDPQIFEYHLRHQQIMQLYRELDCLKERFKN